MRTPRKTPEAEPPPQASTAARGRRAHAGRPADETVRSEPAAPRPPAAPAPTGVRGTGAPAPGAPARGHLRGLRPRTVRAKIVSLLMVPVVSLLALWGFATVTTAQDIARLRLLQSVDADIRQPVRAAVTALQDERRAAVRQVAAPGAGRVAELKDRIARTDTAVARLRLDARHTVGDTGNLPEDVSGRVAAFVTKAEGLGLLRTAAADGRADWDQVYAAYTSAISAGFGVDGALTGIQDPQAGSDARVLLELARAGEMLAREDALLGSAHLTGRLDGDRLRAFGGAVDARRALVDAATADLPAPQRTAWHALTAQPGYRQLTAAEDRVRAADPGRRAAQAAPSGDWDDAHARVRDGIAGVEAGAHRAAAERTDPFGGGAFSTGGAAVLLGLAAVAASLVISVRIGRGLVVELVSLRNSALEIARRKLPAAMRRLRAGEEIDVQAETPPGPAPQDEIGQVGEALTTVHRAALSAAVERAELANGISGVFVNLARRSQVLVHRQLNLLDTMERRADDPNELGDLFRLDHLTTRMRRHAESLIILSGAAPGRAWRTPVPLTNVVRAAVSEIEDYARVEVRRLPETAIVGGAVADLTHLLAELIENAAQFSPPHTKVRISGEPVGNGYALEIEDRGLGMGKDSLTEANARIAQSEALDLFDSDRLGLFVVSRLSARHEIAVHLRTSPYGGTTAVVLLPTDLLQGALPPGRSTAPDRPDPAVNGPGPAREPEIRHASGAPVREEPPAPAPVARTAGAVHGRDPEAPRPPRIPALPAPREGRGAPISGDSPEQGQPPAGVTAIGRRPRSVPPAPPARPAPVLPPPPAPPAGATDGRAPEADGHEGPDPSADLPRRVRQASLVPQLREAPASAPYSAADPAPTTAERTPEQVRDRMTAYRDGWQRGGGPTPGTPLASRRPLGTGHHGRPASSAPGSEGDDA
ncbi:nitrate- and nitrite sensing domain-containing protein [Streptomyces sp. NBC_01268]|uniref:nitrate- and nitrite sensing domain-containing protein n=1 Tax=Streptomyces sp. NBC_01268 TaxID=2903806 RepID=UPI002E3184C9|nr:nitrate- and nitrite sensing domain-containing protein [Streptomyces sp. NBC_01268]